ncbi:MAG: AAA family ATPase [Blastocatellia bacterium]|nr:AAA family ATPase [Blastocatellia bacterium]
MRLKQLDIENFRRIQKTSIHFAPSTFIVGPNNTAKSSVIAALDALLSLEREKLTQIDIHERPDGSRAEKTTITAYFSNIPPDVAAGRGFRGRVVDDQYVYRKTLTIDSTKPKIETRQFRSAVKAKYQNVKSVGDLLAAGISAELIKEALGPIKPEEKLVKDWYKSFPDTLKFDTTSPPEWVENPGGIPQNVLSRLPRLIHIPALTEAKEIESDDRRYALGECLSLLFEDLMAANPLADEIQGKLNELEKQMNPADDDSLIFLLVQSINRIIGEVFPKCGIAIEPSLQDLLEILKPKYDIKVFSNIRTGAMRQGTGLIRTCAFAMLRYHAKLKLSKDLQTRPVVVAFEEPELFLHPSAANLLRDTIYSLGASDQIVCTTHSPWMIDLSQDPQSITRMRLTENEVSEAVNYGVSSALGKLPQDDRTRVKMLQMFDDELSRVFFAERVVIVEGDSEILAIKQTLRVLPEEERKLVSARFQVVKARGKASIISLVKYLRELQIDVRVMHDGDFGVAGAERFNAPIAAALGDSRRLVVLNPNLEHTMGYPPPKSDKPYLAFLKAGSWSKPTDVPEAWREAMRVLFEIEWSDL